MVISLIFKNVKYVLLNDSVVRFFYIDTNLKSVYKEEIIKEEKIINNLDSWVNNYNISKEAKDYIVNNIMIQLYSKDENKMTVFVSNNKFYGFIKLKINLTKDNIIEELYETSQLLLHGEVELENIKIEVKNT